MWTKTSDDPPKFHALGPLQPEDVPNVLTAIALRVHKLLKQRGLLHDDDANDDTPTDDFAQHEPALAAVLKSSLFDLTLFGPKAKPEREWGAKPAVVHVRSRNCADLQQFSLHANTNIAACNRVGPNVGRLVATVPVEWWHGTPGASRRRSSIFAAYEDDCTALTAANQVLPYPKPLTLRDTANLKRFGSSGAMTNPRLIRHKPRGALSQSNIAPWHRVERHAHFFASVLKGVVHETSGV